MDRGFEKHCYGKVRKTVSQEGEVACIRSYLLCCRAKAGRSVRSDNNKSWAEEDTTEYQEVVGAFIEVGRCRERILRSRCIFRY